MIKNNESENTPKLEKNKTQPKSTDLELVFKKYCWYFIAAISFICLLPFLFTNFLIHDKLAFNDTGEIGDTIGGIMGPFVGIVASAVTFLAFWQQYKANFILQEQLNKQEIQYKEDNKKQKRKESLDRFENKYYELLRFHRANLDEMRIGQTTGGRKCFVEMYKEFKFCYDVSLLMMNELNEEDKKEISCITTFAYKIFFYGIGEVSEKQHQFNDAEKVLYNLVKDKELIKLQESYRSYYSNRNNTSMKFPCQQTRSFTQPVIYCANYFPFDGHVSRLAHYYRHLFHTVKFVAKQNENFISFENKLEYLQMLRAQLSNHEQAMLYYNAIAGFSQAWFKNEYFTKYKMIHNLPFALADFGVLPHDHEKIKEGIAFWKLKGAELFEQDEEELASI